MNRVTKYEEQQGKEKEKDLDFRFFTNYDEMIEITK